MITSSTPDNWEQLADTLVNTQQQTQESYAEAEQAHAQLRQVAQTTIENLRSANELKRSAIAAAKGERQDNKAAHDAAAEALEAKLAELAKTRAKVAETIAKLQSEISTMQQSSTDLQKANDDLVNNPTEQERAYHAWWQIMYDRARAGGFI